MGFNRNQLDFYFKNLTDLQNKYKFPAHRIFNQDETGVQTVPGKLPKTVAPTGKHNVSKAVSAEKGETISVSCCMSGLVTTCLLYTSRCV